MPLLLSLLLPLTRKLTWANWHGLAAAAFLMVFVPYYLTTNDPDYAEILRSLRSHGRSCSCKSCVMNSGATYCAKRFKHGTDIRFIFQRVGYSSKMNELEAAVGLGNLEAWPGYLARRRENLLYLLANFKKYEPDLLTFSEAENEFIGPHAFPVIVGKKVKFTRDQLVDHLGKNGIDSRNMFLSMPTQCPGFAYLGNKLGQFPAAEYVGNHGLHIGLHQDLNLEHMKYFIETIEGFLSEAAG